MNKFETTIPIEAATLGLTLEEIGVVCVLMLYPNLPEKSKIFWGTDEIFQTVLRGLEKRGVVEIEGVNMKINLKSPDDVKIDRILTDFLTINDIELEDYQFDKFKFWYKCQDETIQWNDEVLMAYLSGLTDTVKVI